METKHYRYRGQGVRAERTGAYHMQQTMTDQTANAGLLSWAIPAARDRDGYC